MNSTVQDHVFTRKLESFTPLSRDYSRFFYTDEIREIADRYHSFDIFNRRVVFLSMENAFASLGGLGTIVKYLPAKIAQTGELVTFITPLYRKNERVKAAIVAGQLEKTSTGKVFESGSFNGSFSIYKQKDAPVPSYFIDCPGFFSATSDPYSYDDPHLLLRDALAFSVLVPYAMRELGLTHNITLHANDWETAPLAITSKLAMLRGIVHSVKTVLTLHNSFDAKLVRVDSVFFLGRPAPNSTVLSAAIPFVDAPLTTVSEQFARELMADPLQRWFFAPHLAPMLSRNPPVGIDNGLFGSASKVFTADALANAKDGSFTKLLDEKRIRRRALEEALAAKIDKRIVGKLSFPDKKGNIPILFMSGRFDLTQKGFDVVCHAVKQLPRGSVKLIFSPSAPTTAQADQFEFFAKTARELDGDMVILPFRIDDELYRLFLEGSSWLVMPSFYEPFGAATEGFLHGTPVIARATGGLLTQVDSVEPIKYPGAGFSVLDTERIASVKPDGFLYRENYDSFNMVDQWRQIYGSLPHDRMMVPLYLAMVDSARRTIESAISIKAHSEAYGQLILNGLDALERFSWDKAVAKYRRVYNCCSRHAI